MKKFMSLSVMVFLGLAGTAHASTLDVTLGSTGTDLSYGVGGTLIPNEQLSGDPNLVLGPSSSIISASAPDTSLHTRPTGTIFGDNFLAVNMGGSATLTLAPGLNSFGFTWGTIDDFNSLVVTDSRNVQYTITGADVLANIAGSNDHATQSDVIFNDTLGTIKSVIFESPNGNSFEVANVQDGAELPLPASLPLFAAAFLGLFVMSRRNAKRA